MKIYTKKGDFGTTGLFKGGRVSKGDLSIIAAGSVDETNCHIGMIRSKLTTTPAVDRTTSLPCHMRIEQELVTVQSALFDIGAIISTNIDWLVEDDDNINRVVPVNNLRDKDINALEVLIDQMDEQLPPLTNFVLPSGNELHCVTQIARAVCRRAERDVVAWSCQYMTEGSLWVDGWEHCLKSSNMFAYLNRLSDFLFVLCRYFDSEETKWMGRSKSTTGSVQLELFNDQK